MSRWAKILTSGSNAEVTNITASDIGGPLSDSASLLMIRAGATNRSFITTESLFFTESAGGQLYFDNIGLAANQLFISGVPDDIPNNSQVLFYEQDSTGLQRTSSLFFEDGNLRFNGTFSGSFTGNGSGLTGVVGTMDEPLISSRGIGSSSGVFFSYDGTDAVTMSILTASGGGLDFENNGLRLTESLAGDGLYWHLGSGDYSKISIGIPANSGLTTGSDTISIDSNIGGDGIDFSGGAISIDLSGSSITDSGMSLIGSPKKLALASTLAGSGLDFSNGRSELNIDPDYAVTASDIITFKTGSDNLTLTADNASAVAGGFAGNLINEPVFTFSVSDNLTGDFTLDGNFTISGSLKVTGSNSSASFHATNLSVADQFVLLNSGSNTGDGGFRVQTAVAQAATLFYDDNTNRWGVTANNASRTANEFSVTESIASALNTTTITTDNHATILGTTPMFGNDDASKGGQFIMTTNPSTNESPFYIYA